MKLKWKHWWVLCALTWFASSCSSDQQGQQEEVETQEENDYNQQDEGEELSEENQSGEYDQYGQSENLSNLEDQNAENNVDNAAQFEGDQLAVDQGEQGDLQEIIDEMNQGENQLALQDQGQVDTSQYDAGGLQEVEDSGEPPSLVVDQAEGNYGDQSGSMPVAAGAISVGGLPEMGSKMSYVVQRGDTLGRIAAKIYGNSAKWREIAEFSGIENSNLIYPGDLVYYQLTELTTAFASRYENLPRAETQVQKGDTLSTIAGRVLGSSADWKMIWRENDSIDNPDRLKAGTVLYYIEPGVLQAQINDHNNANDSINSIELAQVNSQQNIDLMALNMTDKKICFSEVLLHQIGNFNQANG